MNPNVYNIKQMYPDRTIIAVLASSLLMAAAFVTTLQANEPKAPGKSSNGGSLTQAQKLATSDPKADFAAAKQKDDIHFLAIMGFAKEVPGIEGPNEAYLKRAPVKVVEGTGDYLKTKQDEAIREKVRDYVRTYNGLVLQFLKEQDKHSK